MEQIMALGKEYFYFVFIAIGAIIVIGCIFNWEWASRITSPSKLTMLRTFIEELHGKEARYKFERIVSFFCGILLIILGLFYWYFYTR